MLNHSGVMAFILLVCTVSVTARLTLVDSSAGCEDKTKITKSFLETIEKAGYKAMVYGNKEWLLKKIDLSKLTEYDIWLSQPGDLPDYPYKFTMWQYSTTANIDGIAGYANLNISFIDYSEK